jgi:hypothetical protein
MRTRQSLHVRVLPLAIPAALAAFGVAPAIAVGGGLGLSITPPLIEHAAVPGNVGSVKVDNETGRQMKITVSAHPWIQSASGVSVPNQRATLGGVRSNVAAFTLASGASRVVTVSLLHAPKAGSVYGNVDVTGVPVGAPAPNAVTVGYRLVSSLRLDPLHPARRAAAGRAAVTGNARHGTVVLAVRNTGNTIEPIGGSVRITGARGAETGSIAAFRILPGRTVDVPAFALDGSLPAGSYTLSAWLSQGGHHILSVERGFSLR